MTTAHTAMRYILLFLLPVALLAQPPQQPPWTDPFAGSPGAILRAAALIATPGDSDVVILLDERHYGIQGDGRILSTERKLFRLLSQDAVDDWSNLEQEWQPWHQSKPGIRARVITEDGVEHVLDPKTIADAPAYQWEPNVFSDDRVVRVPLPALAKGAVVEYQITMEDTAPLFSAGIAQEVRLNSGIPEERFHLTLDAAAGIPLKTATDLIPPSAIQRTQSKHGFHVEIALGPLQKNDDFEWNSPSDQRDTPAFRFATGKSWQEIAATYNDAVNAQIAGSDLKPLLEEAALPDHVLPPIVVAAKLTAILHKHVRYTGIEFGQAAIIPNKPGDVISRHYGDCKDKAVLLAALLRAAGLDAHLALLRVGEGADVDMTLPGFGQFNHAIVYVPGKESLWIDATAETSRVGTLPILDQGRHALVISENVIGLIDTPASKAADNRIVHHIEVRLSDQGKANVEEEIEAAGAYETAWRARFTGDEAAVKKSLEAYVQRAYSGASLGTFSTPSRSDFSRPFRMSVEAKNSAAGITELEGARANLSASFVFEGLPYGVQYNLASDAEDKPRLHDFIFDEPYHAEVHFTIRQPAGFTAKQLPAPDSFTAGHARYSSTAKRQPDGSVEVTYTFDSGDRRYSPADFAALRAELKKHVPGSPQLVEFTHPAADSLALGKTKQALQLVRADVSNQPQNPLLHLRFAKLLTNAGAGDAAVAEARQAINLDPKSSQAHTELAYAYEHDSFGRLRAGNWNRAEAEKALRMAIELDGSDLEPQMELAILSEYDVRGDRYSAFAPLPTAVEQYRAILKKEPNDPASQNLAILLLHMGLLEEARQQIEKLNNELLRSLLETECTALTSGADDAILQAPTGLDPAARAGMLSEAGWDLLQMRRYPEGLALLRAAERISSNPQIASVTGIYGRVKRFDDQLEGIDSPKLPVQRFLALVADDHAGEAQFREVLAEDTDWNRWQSRIEKLRTQLATLREALRSNGGSVAVLPDVVVSWSKFSVDGEGKPAYRITTTSNGLPAMGVGIYYVVQSAKGFRILATADGLDEVGRRVLALLKKKDLAEAQQWLDFLNGNALPEAPRDDKGPAVRYLWAGVAPETRGDIFIRAAAASLIGTYAGSDDAIRVLRETAAKPPRYMEPSDLQFAICEALYKAERWKELVGASRTLLDSTPSSHTTTPGKPATGSQVTITVRNRYLATYSEVALRFFGEATIRTQQWNDLQKVVTARLNISPKDHAALQYAAILAMRNHEFDAATKWIDLASTAGFMQPLSDTLIRDWNHILANKVTPEDVNEPNQPMFFGGTEADLATMALLQLCAGKEDDFRHSFSLALARSEDPETDGIAWLVEAKLLQHYGLDEQADQALHRAYATKSFGELDWAALLLQPEAIDGGSSQTEIVK